MLQLDEKGTSSRKDQRIREESVNLASRKYPEEHKNSKFVMQKLEKSSLRDLKEETDYDYVDISVNEHIEEEEADLGAEVLVHECGKMVFVSAARAKGDRNENVSIWANYSKDLSFLDYCCYKWDSILIKKFGPGEINNGENIDATIEHVKFGYELPGKNLTREQQLGAKYKYGFSLAERPRLVNQLQPYRRSCKFSSKCLFPIDGCFIGPPKLSVEQSEEHKVNIQFSDDDGTKWENGSRLVQVRQWAIRCDCSNAKEGTNGLMRQLKFSTPRIYAAVIDNEAKQQRDTKIGDLVNTVTVDSRTKVTRDSSGRPFILYNAKEWKGI